jgi:hypothetical protein
MILLAIRVEMEVILKMNYGKFLELRKIERPIERPTKKKGEETKEESAETEDTEEMEIIIDPIDKKNYIEREGLCMRLVNGVITELLDNNIYYSRFSFLESGKEALDIKNQRNKDQGGVVDKKLKYYTRSALIKNLIPMPSEGKVRALFSDG